MKKTILIFALAFISNLSFSQCNCETIKRDDGTNIVQCNSLPVASDNNTQIGLAIASFLGQWFVENEIFNHELIAIAFGVFGGYLGFCLARHQQKRGKYCNLLIPRILRINPSSINIVEITD